jgi:hypothetical protein
MFTLEESALLRRMLLVSMWLVVVLCAAGALVVSRPWLGPLWSMARALVAR